MSHVARVTKLEATTVTQEQTIIARVPAYWDDNERDYAIQNTLQLLSLFGVYKGSAR